MEEEGLKEMSKSCKSSMPSLAPKTCPSSGAQVRSTSIQTVRHQVRRTLKTRGTEADLRPSDLLLPQSPLSIPSSAFDKQRGMSDRPTYCTRAI